MTHATKLDRANKSKVSFNDGAPDGSTRGNIYLDQLSGLLYVKSGDTWYVCGDKLWNLSGETIINRDSRAINITTALASNLTVTGATADLTFGARGEEITLNQAGETSLHAVFGAGGATSIIGAFNLLVAAAGISTELDEGYNNFGANPATITIDNNEGQGSLTWNIVGAYDFIIGLDGVPNDQHKGFKVVCGADKFDIWTTGYADVINADIDCSAFDLDASGAVTIDAAGNSNFTTDSASLTLSTTTSGNLIINGVALVDINAGANLDIDVTGNYTMDSTGTYSVDAVGNSNVTTDTGDLTLSTTTSGTLIIDGVALVDLNAADLDIDTSASIAIDATTTIEWSGTNASLTKDGILSLLDTVSQIILDNHTATSGDVVSIKSTPGSASTARVMILEAVGAHWGSGAHVLEIISDDNDAVPLVISSRGGDTITMGRLGAIAMSGDLTLTAGGSILSTANGDITMNPNGSGDVILSGANATLDGSGVLSLLGTSSAISLIAHTATSGDVAYIKSTPASSSTARVCVLHADGTSWGSGAHVLEIISDDADARPFTINDGSSDNMWINRDGKIVTAGDLQLTAGGSIVTTAAGDLTLAPDTTGTIIASNDLDVNADLLQTVATVSSATHTVSAGERFIFVSYTDTGTVVITIPSALIAKAGWCITIKDTGFNATVNNITIVTAGAETIEEQVDAKITGNGQALTLCSDGSNLFVI